MIKIRKAILAVCVVLITGCAEQLPPLNFSPPNVGMSAKKIDAEVRSLTVAIGRPDEQVGDVDVQMIEGAGLQVGNGAMITQIWRSSIEESLNRMVVFRDDSPRKISLSVKILKLDVPMMGATFTTTSVARYEIIDRANGDIIFMSDVASSGVVPPDYAFVGAIRARESVNRAAQNNITQFLQQLETVNIEKPMFPSGTTPPRPSRVDGKAPTS